MCGIAGVIGSKGSPKEQITVLHDMQQTLKRRGPNQQGTYTSNGASLIHTRLCVIDTENGKLPMEFAQHVLVCNGTIYNAPELRKELETLGHKFRSRSDAEVLLHSYVEWKESCVDRLNGVFAFAVWDNKNHSLFFARDRIGVKPLFYARRDGVFIFASEIKTILAHPLIKPEIDTNTIAEIMLLGPGRTSGCGVFKGIEELMPGFYGDYKDSNLKLRRYWHMQDKPHTDSFDQTVEKTRVLLLDSIKRQMVSDVPIGTFLSGGVDSSVISAVANGHLQKENKTLHTFSVDYKDNAQFFEANRFQPGDDRPYIEEMVKFLGSEHHQIILDTDELADALYAAADARDLPGMADIDASLLLFSKKVKEHVSVALSGECADELFGGYPWYRDKDIREYEGFPWSRSTDYRASFLRPELAIDADEYIRERYARTIAGSDILPGTSPLERRMKEMVNLNFHWFMQTLLDRNDRMTMYSGLEVRVPFCDYRIVEYLYTVPWEMKDYQGREKGLLRHAMDGLLPENVLWRKKSPYPKTHNPSYLKVVQGMLREVIADPNAPILQFIRKEALESLLNEARPIPWYGQLMTTPQTIAYFLQFDYWLRSCF